MGSTGEHSPKAWTESERYGASRRFPGKYRRLTPFRSHLRRIFTSTVAQLVCQEQVASILFGKLALSNWTAISTILIRRISGLVRFHCFRQESLLRGGTTAFLSQSLRLLASSITSHRRGFRLPSCYSAARACRSVLSLRLYGPTAPAQCGDPAPFQAASSRRNGERCGQSHVY